MPRARPESDPSRRGVRRPAPSQSSGIALKAEPQRAALRAVEGAGDEEPPEQGSASAEPSSSPDSSTSSPVPISTVAKVARVTEPEAPVSAAALDLPPLGDSPDTTPPHTAPAKPVLASEALMEELAPMQPGRRDARAWCTGAGALLVLVGLAPLLGLQRGGLHAGLPALIAGVLSLLLGAANVPYRQRALSMAVVGTAAAIVGLRDAGAVLAKGAGGEGLAMLRLLAAVAIASALYFRTRYRAYKRAKVFLAVSLVASIPFVAHVIVGYSHGVGAAEIGSFVALAAIVASFSGFTGAETAGSGLYLAPFVVVSFAADLAVRAAFLPGAGALEVATAALAFLAACSLATVGVFQLVASRIAVDARRIDLHPPPSRSPESAPDRPSDWLM